MIAIKHFRECIVRPTLDQLKLYSLNREELLVITCAQESLGGTYLKQNDALGYPKGPALGIYQMEPTTYQDLFANFLHYQTLLRDRLGFNRVHSSEVLVYDNLYATMIACLQYYRFPEVIPDDLEGQFLYYKKYWNTAKGKATIPEVRRNYERFIQSA